MAYISFQPKDYFNTKLYTGTGATQSISSVGFQPDWVWIKSRGLARSNQINDAVRGAGKILATDNNDAEFTDTNRITTLDSDGFTLGSNDNVNGSSDNLVSWNWKAGTSFTNDASATGIGTIDSTGSFNNDAGFSIVSYTGNATDNASVKHGLNTAPKMVIIKDLSDTSAWGVWHQSLTNGGYRLTLSSTAAQADDSTFIGGSNRAIPTSSVFFLGSGGGGNGTNANIAYCFAEKTGFSKFMGWSGNGSTDGTFLYTGFKPALFIYKVASGTTGDWGILDNKRDTFNPVDNTLSANTSGAEFGDHDVDFLSNGLKIRSGGGNINLSGATYIGMAFASEPLVSSNGVPSTAR